MTNDEREKRVSDEQLKTIGDQAVTPIEWNMRNDLIDARAEIAQLKALLEQKDIARELQINEYERITDEHATRLAAAEAKLERVDKILEDHDMCDLSDCTIIRAMREALYDMEAQ